MKRQLKIFILTFFNFLIIDSFGSQISVGIFTKEITIWRFWEQVDNNYQYKMIIFNTSDSIVELTLRQQVYNDDGMHFKNDTSKAKILFNKLLIEKNRHLIIELPQEKKKYRLVELLAFTVNGKNIGTLDMTCRFPPQDLFGKKFCSDEGLNGGQEIFWISKNNLITKNLETDTMHLHFFYKDEPRNDKDGIYHIVLWPFMKFNKFMVTLNNQAFGNFNYKGEYSIELPYCSDYDSKRNLFLQSNPHVDIAIAFEVEKTKSFSLGLDSRSGINLLQKGETLDELRKRITWTSGCILPIMVE